MRNFNQQNPTSENQNSLAWQISDAEIAQMRRIENENERARVVEVKDEENLAEKVSAEIDEIFAENDALAGIFCAAEMLIPDPAKIFENGVEKTAKLTDEAVKMAVGGAAGENPKAAFEHGMNLVAPIVTPENFAKVGGGVLPGEISQNYNSAMAIVRANRLAKIKKRPQ